MIDAKLPTARLINFAACGSFARIEVSDEVPPAHRIRAGWCNDRWCAVCARRRATKQRLILVELLELGKALFVTLTLRAHPAPAPSNIVGLGSDDLTETLAADLAVSLKRLQTCFARLRATDLWKHRVTAGRAFIEIKWNPETRAWHPHLHVLCVGKYMVQKQLSTTWLQVTGDSFIVDIRRPESAEDAARYVTKYVTKAVDKSVTADPVTLGAAIRALHRVRTVIAFGKPVHCPKRDPEHLPTWTVVGSLKQVLDDALNGDSAARLLLQHFHWLPLPAALAADERPQRTKDPPCGSKT
jgi:hypothetical protein